MNIFQLSEKRKLAKKEGKMTIEEDDPEVVGICLDSFALVAEIWMHLHLK